MYFVHRIIKFLYDNGSSLLPTCEFVLTKGSNKITVTGFLTCHHSNIGYEVNLSGNRITSIISMKSIKKKSLLPKLRDRRFPNYEQRATEALTYMALWVVSVIYPIYELKKMDIDQQFQLLTNDIENLCKRGVPYAQHLYNLDKATDCIKQSLIIMGEKPYNDFIGFKQRMLWQKQTQYDTASYNNSLGTDFFGKPVCYSDLKKYKEVYSTQIDIDTTLKLASVFTPESTTLIRGSINTGISGDIVVLNLEDAYRVRCQSTCPIYMMTRPNLTPAKCRKLGIGDIKLLPSGLLHINVAFCHLWGMKDLTKLIQFQVQSYTLIGRLDQYPRGRGQFYRDMVECGKFRTEITKHVGTDNVIQITSTDIPATIAEISSKHGTIQCFASEKLDYVVDTGRRKLLDPFRIRSLRPRKDALWIKAPRVPLYEECYTTVEELGDNCSVTNVRSYCGVHTHACVFICSDKTTAFDIAVAKSHCREALYLINGGNYFLLENKCQSRCTVNPFQ